MLRPFIGIGFLAWAGAALAEPVSVSNDDLKALVSGAMVEIDTPLGTKIPIRFGKDGLVSGQALDLAPLLGSEKDRGRWWVDGDKLCSKWFRWFDAEVRCITVQKDGDRLFWRKVDDGETGTATLIDGGTPAKPAAPRHTPTIVAEAKVKTKAASVTPAPPPAAPPAAASAAAEIPLPEKTPASPPVFATADASGTGAQVEYKAAAADPAPAKPEASPLQVPATVSGAPSAPSEVALADPPAPQPDEGDDGGPMMRFGGHGLLEASSRVGADHAAPATVAPLPVPDPSTESADVKAPPPVRDAAPEAQKPEPQKVAALPSASAPPPAHRPVKPRTVAKSTTVPVKRGSGAVTTAAIRPVVLYRVRGVDRDDVLNVRRGPSETHDQIAAIPPSGRRVVITGPCEQVWCPIQYGRIKGWVNSLYLAEETPQAASASEVYTAKR